MNWLLTHFFFMGYRYESTDLQCTIIDAKIVKGERNTKPKVYFWVKILPNRILFYRKIVKGECNTKPRACFWVKILPNRLLFYTKIVKGECKTKPRACFWVKILPNRLLFYTKIVNNPLNSRLSRVNRVHLHDQTLRFSEAFTMNPPIIQL